MTESDKKKTDISSSESSRRATEPVKAPLTDVSVEEVLNKGSLDKVLQDPPKEEK